MTNIEKAIKKAIEGGWKGIDNAHTSEETCPCCGGIALLDPLFWQSLGKAMGWTGDEIRLCVGCGRALKWNQQHCTCGDECIEHYAGQWLIEWHKFIDHLAEGKDAESFFANLLK